MVTKYYNKTSIYFSTISFPFLFMLFSSKAIATDTLTRSEGISFGQTLVSSAEVFELGFFSPGSSTSKYIGIRYRNIAARKIVWVANRDNPLKASHTTAILRIGRDGNLVLLDSMKNIVWSTNVSFQINNAIVVLSDNGNLILKDNVTGLALWESFNYPGDTSIPGITIGPKQMTGKHSLSSWKTEEDPSPGVFVCDFTTETPPQVVVKTSTKLYWRSGPWDGAKFVINRGFHKTGVGYANGLTVMQNSEHGYKYLVYSQPSSSHVAVYQLTVDGNIVRSDWDLVTGKGGLSWQAIEVPFDVYGTCGVYGFWKRERSSSCECLKGFIPKSSEEWAKGNWTSGCVRRTELLCERNTSTVEKIAKKDGFLKYSSMKLPDKYKYHFQLDPLGCKQFCLSHCSCVAYSYPDGIGCMVWYVDLIDIQQFPFGGADMFLRLAHSELGEKRKSIKIIISVTTILGVFLLCVFLCGLLRWKANRKVKKGREGNEADPDTTLLLGSQTDSSDIPMFKFNTLKVATNNFSETNKLGGGGFGSVYKGKLEDGKYIAVKRLSSLSGQGGEEFKNEILMISKLQHRNLVKLRGYCIKKDEKLIIYEYMKNRSLDTFLFDKTRAGQLDWSKRLNIIHGIARGLLYLHRDSCLRIIHRDLKASNILLDDRMNPKISDFGLARSFQITQEQANTNRVVGTFGYISPEYAMGGLVSEKSDVYSFGVLLLEIISGMRITNIYDDGKNNLLCYAWHSWEEGKPLELMNESLFSSCPDSDFVQCMHIGLLCVQDHTVDRPTMSTVVLMLTSQMDLPQPKQPIFYKNMLHFERDSQPSPKFYSEVDDKVDTATLLPFNGQAQAHDSSHPKHRHNGAESQSCKSKELHNMPTSELKIKSI